MFELIGIGVTAAVVLVTIVLFFNRLQNSIDRLCEEVADNKVFLSEEHKRHDEKLSKELQGVVRGLDGHISNEEVEAALQARSREDIKDIVKLLNSIQCRLKEK